MLEKYVNSYLCADFLSGSNARAGAVTLPFGNPYVFVTEKGHKKAFVFSTKDEGCNKKDCVKELKQVISKMNKRTFLSITPKVEDLKLV